MNASLSVVLPTYNRGAVLLDTLDFLFAQSVSPGEIIVVDQTQYVSGDEHASRLSTLHKRGKIIWVRRTEPSIPQAMNQGLITSASDWVLFLDDDVEFARDFIQEHLRQIEKGDALAHVGQIVQPWQEPNTRMLKYESGNGLYEDLDFRFNADREFRIRNCMAGNLCVSREAALNAGGFDENFTGSAFRFETEFCKRFCLRNKTLFKYTPTPKLDHLYVKSGGTRAHANHLTSFSPAHSMGDYYYALLNGLNMASALYVLRRLVFSLKAKFYLKKPWYIPVRIVAEVRGLVNAILSIKKGQSLVSCDLETAR